MTIEFNFNEELGFIVPKTEVEIKYVKMYQLLTSYSDWKKKIFMNKEDAIAWLKE